MNKKFFKNKNIITFLFLFCLILFFFNEVIFFKKCFIGGDSVVFSYPNRFFMSQCIKNGEFPLWNAYIGFGFPVFASGQAGILYPFNLLFTIFPFYHQVNYNIILHFFLSGIFIILFLSLFIKDRMIQLLGAVMWVFSGLFIFRMDHIEVIFAITYIPLFFFLIEKYLIKKNKIYIVILAPIISLVIFINHQQVLLYTLIALVIYYIVRAIHLKQEIFNYKILVFVILGFLMGFVQILPTLDLTSISVRSGGLEAKTIYGSDRISLFNLLNIIYPYLFGSTHNNTFIGYKNLGVWSMSYMAIYTGIISFLMLILSYKLIVKHKIIILFWVMILFSLLFSFGQNFFINQIILNLPGFNYFRNPIKMLQIYAFFSVVLTAYVIHNIEKKDIPLKVFKIFFIFIVLVILAVFTIKMMQNAIFALFSDKIENIIKTKVLDTIYHHYGYEYYYDKFIRTISFILNHILQQSFFLGIFVFLIIIFGKGKLDKQKFVFFILIFTILELFINGKSYNGTIDKEFIILKPEIVDFLEKKDRGFYRVLSWRFYENQREVFKSGRASGTYDEFMQSKEILQPNTNTIYGIFSYWGYDPLYCKKYSYFFSDIDRGTVIGGDNSINDLKKGFNTLILSGVKYIFSPFVLKMDELKEIGRIKNIYIYENLKVNELVEFFTDVIYVSEDKETLDLIKGNKIDFQNKVIINDDKYINYSNGEIKSEIKILKWGNGKIEFDINTDKDGIVVISSYFDSEKQNKDYLAYVDGKRVNILSANYIFMGLKINKGFHKVRIIYSPYFFKVGILISLISFVFYVLFSFVMLRFKI